MNVNECISDFNTPTAEFTTFYAIIIKYRFKRLLSNIDAVLLFNKNNR